MNQLVFLAALSAAACAGVAAAALLHDLTRPRPPLS